MISSMAVLLYPVVLAAMLLLRAAVFVVLLPTYPIRRHMQKKREQAALLRQNEYILATARERAWAIHQATHPNPLTKKPWE